MESRLVNIFVFSTENASAPILGRNSFRNEAVFGPQKMNFRGLFQHRVRNIRNKKVDLLETQAKSNIYIAQTERAKVTSRLQISAKTWEHFLVRENF